MALEVVTVVVDDPAGPVGMSAYLAAPADRIRGSVIVAHELFGVNSDIRSIVDSLAEQGYLAIAPEFYHRFTTPGTSFAKDDAGRAQAFSHVHQLTREQAVRDVAATMRYVDDRASDSGPISVLGFSFGAAQSAGTNAGSHPGHRRRRRHSTAQRGTTPGIECSICSVR